MPSPRRPRRLVGAATVVTAAVVTTGVLTGGTSTPSEPAVVERASLGSVTLPEVAEIRTQRLSRTASRVSLDPRPVAHKYALTGLALRTAPNGAGVRSGWVKKGTRVAVTGQVVGTWAEVLLGDEVRWGDARELSATKPKPKPKPKPQPVPEPEPESGSEQEAEQGTEPEAESSASTQPGAGGGLSTAPCPAGSSIESGITAGATAVYRAVCAAFPQPQSYSGYDPHGEHVDGRAIDIMVSGGLGQQIADWLRSNAGPLRIRTVIFAQQIWTPERAGEGWRFMEDRGSSTANHYDHVHVAVY